MIERAPAEEEEPKRGKKTSKDELHLFWLTYFRIQAWGPSGPRTV